MVTATPFEKTVFNRHRWVSTSRHGPSVEMMSFRKRHLANRVRAVQKTLKYGTKKRSTVSLLTPVMFTRTRLPGSPVFFPTQSNGLFVTGIMWRWRFPISRLSWTYKPKFVKGRVIFNVRNASAENHSYRPKCAFRHLTQRSVWTVRCGLLAQVQITYLAVCNLYNIFRQAQESSGIRFSCDALLKYSGRWVELAILCTKFFPVKWAKQAWFPDFRA